jgi:hypothetical protein
MEEHRVPLRQELDLYSLKFRVLRFSAVSIVQSNPMYDLRLHFEVCHLRRVFKL